MILVDLSPTFITVFVANFYKFFTDHAKQLIRIGKNSRKLFNFIQYLFVFFKYFFLFEAR